MITQRELLSLSPESCSQVREIMTSHRIINKDNTTTQNLFQENSDLIELQEENSVPKFTMSIGNNQTPPLGALIIPDPIKTYYKSLRPGEAPDFDQLVIVLESGAV